MGIGTRADDERAEARRVAENIPGRPVNEDAQVRADARAEETEGPVYPSPAQRADFVVQRLEQFIRDGRTVAEGMSLRRWQEMARAEIAITVADAEACAQKDDPITRRLLFMASACLTTIGFWGTAVSLHNTAYAAAGLVCAGAGIVLLLVAGEWRFRKWFLKREATGRLKRLVNIENLNRRIKRLERELEKEEKALTRRLNRVKKQSHKALGTEPDAVASDLPDHLEPINGTAKAASAGPPVPQDAS